MKSTWGPTQSTPAVTCNVLEIIPTPCLVTKESPLTNAKYPAQTNPAESTESTQHKINNYSQNIANATFSQCAVDDTTTEPIASEVNNASVENMQAFNATISCAGQQAPCHVPENTPIRGLVTNESPPPITTDPTQRNSAGSPVLTQHEADNHYQSTSNVKYSQSAAGNKTIISTASKVDNESNNTNIEEERGAVGGENVSNTTHQEVHKTYEDELEFNNARDEHNVSIEPVRELHEENQRTFNTSTTAATCDARKESGAMNRDNTGLESTRKVHSDIPRHNNTKIIAGTELIPETRQDIFTDRDTENESNAVGKSTSKVTTE